MTAQQLSLVQRTPATVIVPPVLEEVFQREDAALVISISGGKDSQAMLVAVAALHRTRGWRCALFAIHADLGRTEWAESLPHCQKTCDELGVHLKVVSRPQGDLLQQIQDRMAKLAKRADAREAAEAAEAQTVTTETDVVQRLRAAFGKGENPWPTASMRYCTSDQKRGQLQKAKRTVGWPDAANRYCTSNQKRLQIDTALREYRLVVSAMGMRAQESKNRAKKVAFTIDQDLTGKRFRTMDAGEALTLWSLQERNYPPTQRARLAFEWLPIHNWTLDDVWEACGTSAADLARRQKLYALGLKEQALDGWPLHPAYVYGNERVSCSLCILASPNDLRVGALHNPELYRTYVGMERESGFTFQHKKPLSAIAPELLEGVA